MKIVKKIFLFFIAQFLGLNILFGQETDSTSKVITKEQWQTMSNCSRFTKRTTPMNRGFLLDVGIYTARFDKNDNVGVHVSFQCYLNSRILVGGTIQNTHINLSSNYGIILKNPYINHVNFGFSAEYCFIRKKYMELNFILLNGLARNELLSESLKVKNEDKTSKSDPDSLNFSYALNLNYFVAPVINFSVILFPMKETYNCQLQFYSQIGYRQLMGKTKFGTLNEFSSPFAQVGLRLLMRNDRTYFFEWFNQKFKHKNSSME